MKADLHVHTNISDSSLSIEETLKMACKNGVRYLGIVDHDTVEGIGKAIEAARQYGVEIIPGIEISAYSYKKNKKVHILGYNYSHHATNITKLCSTMLEARTQMSLWQVQKLIENGYDISVEEVMNKATNSTAVYKQHIMDVLVDRGYTYKIYSDLYYSLFKNNGICCGSIDYIDVFEAIKAIKNDGGLAVLAHPGQLDSYDLIGEIVAVGLDGIEINHIDHTPEDILRICAIREKYNLLLTGGSDFHGEYGVELEIGDICMPEQYIEFFKQQ